MGLGLGLSRGDVLDRLGELRVTQSLLGVERGGHAGGGRLEEGIGMRTVSGHLGANATEVCSSRGNDDLELLLAHWRTALSWAASWAPSLERPFWASSRALAVFLSKMFTAFSRALRAAF